MKIFKILEFPNALEDHTFKFLRYLVLLKECFVWICSPIYTLQFFSNKWVWKISTNLKHDILVNLKIKKIDFE